MVIKILREQGFEVQKLNSKHWSVAYNGNVMFMLYFNDFEINFFDTVLFRKLGYKKPRNLPLYNEPDWYGKFKFYYKKYLSYYGYTNEIQSVTGHLRITHSKQRGVIGVAC